MHGMPLGYPSGHKEQRVCGLKKTLYGLKQALRALFGKFTKL